MGIRYWKSLGLTRGERNALAEEVVHLVREHDLRVLGGGELEAAVLMLVVHVLGEWGELHTATDLHKFYA